jgi:hypothetical protein
MKTVQMTLDEGLLESEKNVRASLRVPLRAWFLTTNVPRPLRERI